MHMVTQKKKKNLTTVPLVRWMDKKTIVNIKLFCIADTADTMEVSLFR